MSTIHIESEKTDIAPLVLMPGDPNRAKYIAENYLQDYKCVNNLRGALAYTGYYKNKRITIFPSGMGIPSMGIYSYELFNNYNVEAIIRIGTCGSYVNNLDLNDLFLATETYSISSYSLELNNKKEEIVQSSNDLNNIIFNTSKELNLTLNKGRSHTVTSFYTSYNLNELIDKSNALVTEMENYSLFINAKKFNKKASSILTITDSFTTNARMSSIDREKSLNLMIKLALESIIKL